MKTIPYRDYVLKECERQWHDCQEQEGYEPWFAQPEEIQRNFYNNMYQALWSDRMGLDGLVIPNAPENNAWVLLKSGNITEMNGDIMKSGADIICHQVNCRGVMGAGLAKQTKLANPQVFREYARLCNQYGSQMLGQSVILPVDGDQNKPATEQQFIANCFGQNMYGRGSIQTDYKALKSALVLVKSFAAQHGLKNIAVPYKLGCGLAGGDWNVVFDIIHQVFDGSGLNITIWRYEP